MWKSGGRVSAPLHHTARPLPPTSSMRPSSVLCIVAQLCIVYCGPAWHDTMCTTSAQSVVEYRSQSRGGEHRGDVLSTQYMGRSPVHGTAGGTDRNLGHRDLGPVFLFLGGKGGTCRKEPSLEKHRHKFTYTQMTTLSRIFF